MSFRGTGGHDGRKGRARRGGGGGELPCHESLDEYADVISRCDGGILELFNPCGSFIGDGHALRPETC